MLAFALALQLVGAPMSDGWISPISAESDAGLVLAGRTIPSLVELESLTVRLEAEEVPVGDETTVGTVTLVVGAHAQHEFDGPIRDLEIGAALLSRRDLEFVWARLLAPPLRVDPEDLERALPSPLAVAYGVDEAVLARGDEQGIAVRDEFERIPLSRGEPLGYLVAIGGYAFTAPSVADVLHVLRDGGAIDLSALATWATQAASEDAIAFDDDARGRIMDEVEARLRHLRAPPGYGDFARLAALTGIAQACARPEDLERLLALQRPMGILLASSLVSWDAAAAEEHTLGVSIHGFARQQSRSHASIAWEGALRRLRTSALDRLLRLAYDPIDFRRAPATLRRSPLQPLAEDLLAPINPTQVARALATAQDVTVQAEVLRYYVDVRHDAIAEPLVEWLIEHPERVHDLGAQGLAVLGEAILPVLVRRHGDIDASPAERAVTSALLDALPERLAPRLGETAHSLGVELPVTVAGGGPTVVEILAAIRDHEQDLRNARADELVERVREDAADRASLRVRIRAAGQLAALAPERVPALADELIALHTSAALEFDDELPGELRAVLRQLVDLPLGDRAADAVRAAALTRAELALVHGAPDAALAELESYDPALGDAAVRDRYARILVREVQRGLASREYDRVQRAIDRSEAHVPDLVDVPALRRTLAGARNLPLLVGGAVLLVVLVALGGWAARKGLARRREPGMRAVRRHEHDASEDPHARMDDGLDTGLGGDRGESAGTAAALDVPERAHPARDGQRALELDPFEAWQTAREVERQQHGALDDFVAP